MSLRYLRPYQQNEFKLLLNYWHCIQMVWICFQQPILGIFKSNHTFSPFIADENTEILYGSEFLGYLYRQIIDVTEQDISVILIAILSDCCDVYFR